MKREEKVGFPRLENAWFAEQPTRHSGRGDTPQRDPSG